MNKEEIKVFLATPGDLIDERDSYYEEVKSFYIDGIINVIPTGYEIALASTGYRPQDIINTYVDDCDVFIAVFYRRWGQPTTDSIASSSYTEEEFNRALRRFSATGKPQIFCLFKNIDVESMADPGPQLTKVLEFRRRIELSDSIFYKSFNNTEEFIKLVKSHIAAYHKKLTPEIKRKSNIFLPILDDYGNDINRNKDLTLAKQAYITAKGGRIEEAEQMFASLSQSTITIQVLDITLDFFNQIDNSDAARAVLDKKLCLLKNRRLAAQEYVAITMTQGWLDKLISCMLLSYPPEMHKDIESNLRIVFDEEFSNDLVNALSEYFSLGELRKLTSFYSGDGASILSKMTEYSGTVIPNLVQKNIDKISRKHIESISKG